jgi:hypothetical protein
MRLICACGFFRDIAPYTTNGHVSFTCASCVAEIEKRREVSAKIEKEKLRQQRTTEKRAVKEGQPHREFTGSKPGSKRRWTKAEMLKFIREGLDAMHADR